MPLWVTWCKERLWIIKSLGKACHLFPPANVPYCVHESSATITSNIHMCYVNMLMLPAILITSTVLAISSLDVCRWQSALAFINIYSGCFQMGQMLLVPKPLFLLNANTLCNVFAAVQLRDKSSAVISAVLLKNPQKSLCAFHVKLLQGHEQSWDQMSLIWSCISDVWQPDNETHNVMISKTLRPDCAVNFEAPLFFASASCSMKGGVDFILKISDNMRDKVNSFQIWNTAICLHFFYIK